MKVDFSGQHALVTGGTRGIGRAIVERLAACGAEVVTVGNNPEGIEAIGRIAGVRGLRLDLRDRAETERQADELAGQRFDVLVNNAGINFHAPIGELDLGEFDRVMDVNVRAAVALSRALVPGMAARGYGRVVSISSVFSEFSKARRASYATSKFAVLGFTRTLALDYADCGVLANCVAPGFIGTEMTERALGETGKREMVTKVPVGRLGTPEEVATLVAFLASPLNTFITGQNLFIDGGFSCT